MDAVAYFKAYARMCDSFDSKNNITGKPCVGCPLDDIGRGCHMNDLTNNAEECVAAVEKWAKEHPIKTRQSEFLKMFPNARIAPDGCIGGGCCPSDLDTTYVCPMEKSPYRSGCPECRRAYWRAEVSDNAD